MAPVHNVIQERLQIVGAAVAVVDVIGKFPHIGDEDRLGDEDIRSLRLALADLAECRRLLLLTIK